MVYILPYFLLTNVVLPWICLLPLHIFINHFTVNSCSGINLCLFNNRNISFLFWTNS
ncbi:hypothetical protein Tsubulata_039375, partial [Turnera subulata]